MRMEFIFLGKTKENFLGEGIGHYCGRLKHYVEVDIRVVKERQWSKKVPSEQILNEEGILLLEHVSRPSFVVALDRQGKKVSSEGLAKLLWQWENQGQPRISFVLGGPLGLAASLVNKADLCLSLSDLTFTHEMARMLLLEQLYRASTIRAGQQYHK